MKELSQSVHVYIQRIVYTYDFLEYENQPQSQEVVNNSISDLTRLMSLSLGRVLDNYERRGEDWRQHVTDQEAAHIIDWLDSARLENAHWLKRLDAEGRPKKLMKFSTIQQIIAEADKAMRIANQRLGCLDLLDGEEDIYFALENGYNIIRMLTPAALDRESSLMQHCIGQGAYDRRLADASMLYLSLRDRHGKPHITMEARIHSSGIKVVQFQGKQNKPPIYEYIKELKPWFQAEKPLIPLRNIPEITIGDDGEIHLVYELPARFTTTPETFLSLPADAPVPDYLHVKGDMNTVLSTADQEKFREQPPAPNSANIKNTTLGRLPKTLIVDGHLNVKNNIEEIPEGTIVGGALTVSSTGHIHSIGANCKIGGLLALGPASGSPGYDQDHLPSGLEVGGILSLSNSPIKRLPNDIKIVGLAVGGGELERLPSHLTSYSILHLSGTKIPTIPEGMEIKKLVIENQKLRKLPSNIFQNELIQLKNCDIDTIPKGWKKLSVLSIIGSTVESIDSRLEESSLAILKSRVGKFTENVKSNMFIAEECEVGEFPEEIRSDRISLARTKAKKWPKRLIGNSIDLRGICDCDGLSKIKILKCKELILLREELFDIPSYWTDIQSVCLRVEKGSGYSNLDKTYMSVDQYREWRLDNINDASPFCHN